MFGFFVGQDRKNVENMIPQFHRAEPLCLTAIIT